MLNTRGRERSKLLLAGLLAMLFALTMAAGTAFAETSFTTKVTIDGVKSGDVVAAYRVADPTIDENNNLTWTMTDGLPAAYDTVDELGAITGDGYAYTEGSAAKAAADAIAAKIAGGEGDVKASATGTSAELTLPAGYYLVRVYSTSDTGTVYQNMLVDVAPVADGLEYKAHEDVTATVKSTPVSISKTVGTEGAKTTDKYSAGDSVPFEVTTAIPDYPADSVNATFTIHDKASAGLELQAGTIEVSVDGSQVSASAATFQLDTKTDEYTVTFAKDYVLANTGKDVKVKYYAKLTEAAFSTADGVTGNTVDLTFNPNPYTDKTAKPEDNTTVKTYGFAFKKVDKSGKALPGAEFTLKYKVTDDKGTETEVSKTSVADKDGYVFFEDLAAGSYTISETKVPAGKQKVKDITFELSEAGCTADNPATASVTENNYKIGDNITDPDQPVLPVTGGAGAVAITVVGVVLMAGAVWLVQRARKQQA